MGRPALPTVEVDTARLLLLRGELRLPAIDRLWAGMAERSDREGWPAARFLSALAELESKRRCAFHSSSLGVSAWTRVQAGPCVSCRPADAPPPRR